MRRCVSAVCRAVAVASGCETSSPEAMRRVGEILQSDERSLKHTGGPKPTGENAHAGTHSE